MPQIIYIRHGESMSNQFLHTGGNPSDYPQIADPALTELGKIQSELTAQYLSTKYRVIGEVFSMKLEVMVAPYQRTLDTMKPFVASVGVGVDSDSNLKITIDDDLREYTSPKKSIPDKFTFDHDADFSSFVKRVSHWKNKFTEYLSTCSSDVILIFGHSQFFSVLLALQAGVPLEALSGERTIFHLPNCSISVVRFDDNSKEWEILGVASVGHLPCEYRSGTHH